MGENGNVSIDPLFMDPEHGDFRLRASSPAVDAGCSADTVFDPDGSRQDIGAYGGELGSWR
jgi:hypothetical protein